MTILPGGSSAFRKAAVMSKEAILFFLLEQAHDMMNLNMAESMSVVVVLP